MIISVDDHVVEPPNVWMDRLPDKYKDVGPRIVRAPMGEITFVGIEAGMSVQDMADLLDFIEEGAERSVASSAALGVH